MNPPIQVIQLPVFGMEGNYSPIPLKMNSVGYLTEQRITPLSLAEKRSIKNLGPDRPDLSPHQTFRDSCQPSIFSQSMYNKDWLCGCQTRNAFFCFPCLLFHVGSDEIFTTQGLSDMNPNSMESKCNTHERSFNHLKATMQMTLLGGTTTKPAAVDPSAKLLVDAYNKKADINQHVLSRLIHTIVFCGANGLNLSNSVIKDLLYNLMEVKEYLNQIQNSDVNDASLFMTSSVDIQKLVLSCIVTAYDEKVSEELSNAMFFAVHIDLVSDSSSQNNLTFIFRYIVEGELVERFTRVIKVEKKIYFISEVVSHLNECLGLLEVNHGMQDLRQKLVAVTLGGKLVLNVCGLQRGLRDISAKVKFAHNYSQNLTVFTEDICRQFKDSELQDFLYNVNKLTAFFSQESRSACTILSCTQLTPDWNSISSVINYFYNNQTDLILKMDHVLQGENEDNRFQIHVFRKLFDEGSSFLFYLTLFAKIMLAVNNLDDLIKEATDPAFTWKAVMSLTDEIFAFKNEIQEKYLHGVFTTEDEKRHQKHSNIGLTGIKICNTVATELRARLNSSALRHTSKLIRIPAYWEAVTDDFAFKHIMAVHPMIDKELLRNELKLLHRCPILLDKLGLTKLLQWIIGNGFVNILFETTKLLNILITTPSEEVIPASTTTSDIRRFITSNNSKDDSFSAMCLLFVEKKRISEMNCFNSRVVELFIKKGKYTGFTHCD